LLVVLAGIGVAVKETILTPTKFYLESSKPLTTSGNVAYVAGSPDGNYSVYATYENGGQVLRMINLKTNRYEEKIPLQNVEYSGITISRANFIYYVRRKDEVGQLFRVPISGKESSLVVDDVDSPVSLSPDEKEVVFLRNNPPERTSALLARDLQTGRERNLRTLKWPDNFYSPPFWATANEVVYGAVLHGSQKDSGTFVFEAVDSRSGQVVRSLPKPWQWMSKPAWLSDGHALAVPVGVPGSERLQIRQLNWPGAEDIVFSDDTMDYRDLTATSNSDRIFANELRRQSRIWVAPLSDVSNAHPVSTLGGRFYGIAWTPAGQIITQTETNDGPAIWEIDPGSNQEHAITHEGHTYQEATASPDGRYLVYVSDQGGIPHLWRSDADGKNPVRLTSMVSSEDAPAFMPDGKSILFTSAEGGFSIWQVSIQGGTVKRITDRQASIPVPSPDGQRIACEYLTDDKQTWKVAILNYHTGAVMRVFDSIPAGSNAVPVSWTVDGKNLLYAADGGSHVSNLWIQPIGKGDFPRQLTHFTDDTIFAFALSMDGKSLALLRGKTTSDAVLLQIRH
jgi:Tol biopolymer transport system component